jgi:hypothetical protein
MKTLQRAGFAVGMATVLALFGICFLVFGYALWCFQRPGAKQP